MRTKLKIKDVKVLRLSVLLGLLTFSLVTSSPVRTCGQSAPRFSQPDLINWVNGPAKASVGENAEIVIPPGFSFVSGQDAVTVLKMMNNPAPASLAGILAPASRRYLVIFEYNSVGYVKNAHRQKINSDAVLKYVGRSTPENNTSGLSSVEWQIQPTYQSQQNLLEWAILAKTGSSKTINHVIRLLGREGVLDAIAVQSASATEAVPLKQLVSGMAFKPGYTYADYQEGDKLSERNLAELIAGESAPDLQTASSDNLAYAIAGGVLVLLGAGILVVRRKKSSQVPVASQPLKPVSALNGHTNGNGSAPKAHKPVPVATASPLDRINGKTRSQKPIRRRMFDYQRYYTDLMAQVSDRAEGSAPMPTGHNRMAKAAKLTPTESRRAGMESNGTTNIAANLSLLEGQQRLIEEQQRLIREQAKLIEEKSKVIQEKNQVLDKQSELFGNNIF
ncbi:MAG: DUF2167 domain-containing protein [Akkermansiaceae bacterium]|nr:DUF2167 domain-containing protein [Verrucomicrobiales bacterium]